MTRTPADAVEEAEAVLARHGITDEAYPEHVIDPVADNIWRKDGTTSVADPYTAVEVEMSKRTPDEADVVVRDEKRDAVVYEGAVEDVRAAIDELVAGGWMEIEGHPGVDPDDVIRPD